MSNAAHILEITMPTLDALLSHHGPARSTTAAQVRDSATSAGRAPVLVVLDDDPTGTQSVADLPVLTGWTEADLHWALAQDVAAVYVLTNARSLDPAEAEQRNREVARAALAAADGLGVEVTFVSRSDSTLRGHFPLETDTLVEEVARAGGAEVDGVLLVPAFPDAGRVTVDGVHYFLSEGPDGQDGSGRTAVPVAETEFAADASFGYTSSDLAAWVEEKTAGRTRAADVLHVDLRTIREDGAEGVAAVLATATGAVPVVVDMVLEEDLRVVALGLALARERGQHFIHRVGPPFVRALIGQEPRRPLVAEEIYAEAATDQQVGGVGGLVVVGSHVALTSRQLEDLHASEVEETGVVLDVPSVVDPERREAHLEEVVGAVSDALTVGTVVLSTSRLLVRTSDAAGSLDISRQVSGALVHVVAAVIERRPPRFVVAKGGITSSDVAAHGLGMSRATVRGPMLPGIVSLWEPQDGPGRGIPYVVFAGNVGGTTSLTEVVRTLTKGPTA